MAGSRIRVYLGDVVHNYRSLGPHTFPLNIGYVAAYAGKYYKGEADLEFRLFKFPEEMARAVRAARPDIIGLSNYTWNENLNVQMLQTFRQDSPNSVLLMGGPNFNLYDTERYFLNRPYLDYYVVNQGETGFLNLLTRFVRGELPHQTRTAPVIDNVAYYDPGGRRTVMGDITKRLTDLDVIPSPYLEGLLDEFFEVDLLIPLVETMRGCPFECTFCAWGDEYLRKSNTYSLERVDGEINYIAQRVKHSSYLYFCDSNFGMLKRDRDIALMIREIYERTGYPANFLTSWAKNSSARVIDIAAILGRQVPSVTLSHQSFDPTTLENVKRKNISPGQFEEVRRAVKANDVETHCDLILGLPGETLESYLNGLRTAFRYGFPKIFCFNCRLLGGTELNTPDSRRRYGIRSKFRLINLCYGKYARRIAIDHEEMITATNTMTEGEILSMRPVNWFVYLFWNYRYYLEPLKLALLVDINPVDVFLRVIDDLSTAHDELGETFRAFQEESRNEWYETAEELYEKYSQPDNFARLVAGEFAKLNMKYTAKALFDYKPQMDRKVGEVLSALFVERASANGTEWLTMLADVMRYASLKTLSLREWLGGADVSSHSMVCDYDILEWMRDGGEKSLGEYGGRPVALSFYLSSDREARLRRLVYENQYDDSYLTFMKMLEYIRIEDLFLNVEKDRSTASEIGRRAKGRAIESWLQES